MTTIALSLCAALMAGCALVPAAATPSPTPTAVQASSTAPACSLEVTADEIGHGHTFIGAGFLPNVPLTMTFEYEDGERMFNSSEIPELRSDVRGAFRLHWYRTRDEIGRHTMVLAGGGCEATHDVVIPAAWFPVECEAADRPALSGGGDVDAYAAAVLADSPLNYWRFEERAGDPVDDVTGAAATVVGNAVLGQPGFIDGSLAIMLDGDRGHWVDIPDLELGADFTIEAWFRFCGGFVWFHDSLVGEAGPGADINFYEWRPRLSDGRSEYAISSEQLSLDGWHHLAVTRSAGDVEMFQDGHSVATDRYTEPYPIRAIGAGPATENGETFGGWLDEVAFYDHALTAEAIGAHASAGR